MANNKYRSNQNFKNKNEGGRRDFREERKNPTTARNNKYSISDTREHEEDTGLVIGRNAVRELLKSEREIDKILVQRGEREGSIVVLVAMAVERGIPIVETDKAKLDAMTGFVPHQGIVAMASEKEYCTVDDILSIAEQRGEPAMIVIADGITDPYNLGALIRCAKGAGAHGLIIPKRRSTGLTPLVSKSSAGAIEHLAVAKVSNISNTIRYLKEKGVWIFAAEAGGKPYYETDFKGACALVFGSEGNGVSQIVIDNCDVLTSIPMYGHVNSFNVSTAASVILCEVARQNRT
jgi:23S rRNA (guanosine2251-2'-O)-methyltransferase